MHKSNNESNSKNPEDKKDKSQEKEKEKEKVENSKTLYNQEKKLSWQLSEIRKDKDLIDNKKE